MSSPVPPESALAIPAASAELTAKEKLYDADGDGVLDDREKMVMMYDVDGDGQLDDVEQKMMELDHTKSGHIDNAQVYRVMREQMETQKELFNMKRFVMGLSVFTLLLALSNLGTAFAAARLSKDTGVDSNGVLVNKNGGDAIGVRTANEHVSLVPVDAERRRELQAECGRDNEGTTNCGNGNNNDEDVFELTIAICHDIYNRVATGYQETITLNCKGGSQKNIPLSSSNDYSVTVEDTASIAVDAYEWDFLKVAESTTLTYSYYGGDVKLGPCNKKNGKCKYSAQKSSHKC